MQANSVSIKYVKVVSDLRHFVSQDDILYGQ